MRKLWRWLTDPAPAIHHQEDRRRARLLAALLIVLLPLYFIPETIRSLATSISASYLFVITGVLLVAYVLSRTRHFRWGILLLLGAFTVLPLIGIVARPIHDPEQIFRTLIWVVLTLVLGSLLLSLRGLVALAAANIAAVLLLSRIVPPDHTGHLLYLGGFLIVIATVLFIASSIHHQDLKQIETHTYELDSTMEELRIFSRAVEQSASTIVITDPKGTIEYVNPAFTRITGYSRQEALGQNPRILKSGKHPPEFYEEMWKTISSGQVWQGEFINKKKNGELYWESATISPIVDDGGQIAHYVAVKDDVTSRKKMERKLRQSEQRFRYLFDAAPDAVLVLEGERVITDCNQSALRLYDRPAEEIIGQHITSFMDPASMAVAQEKWARVRQGQAAEGEIRIRRKDGSIITVWRKGTPLLDAEGNMEGVLVYDRDITQRKEAEEALDQAHKQALEASRLKTQLLANVSHDMRTPLGVILGRAEMLQTGVYGPLAEKQRTALTDIISSTEQALTFVNNLVGQAQIEAGKITLSSRPFSPAKLVETTQSTVRALAQAKNLQLTTEIAADIPARLQGDPYWLQQILSNLISNAVKFTDEGSVHIRIYRPDKEHFAIEVADTGYGIPLEEQEHIFEPFHQIDGTASRQQHTGSGLGLSIVKELTALMGGEIQLNSQVRQGSIFTILLPFEPVKEA